VIPWKDDDSVIAYIAAWERARAVWKWGLNVNLASELTGYKISIEEDAKSLEKSKEKVEEEK
jgi:transcription antitermination factor NusA-like protein